ncbi:hypothetical protein Raf01_27980 [Rugosimonospora africana]|uniref:Uncharacterized protein n=1 Tax=Rugosimonospora africana TaxID=556532 RepID=A0A8J3QQF4_9ACTN|nr:hypothetical protein Raf01_27980 [Rugosimonospora africana]
MYGTAVSSLCVCLTAQPPARSGETSSPGSDEIPDGPLDIAARPGRIRRVTPGGTGFTPLARPVILGALET